MLQEELEAGATSSSPGALGSAPAANVGAMASSPDRPATTEVSPSADDLAARVTAMVLAALESAKVNPSSATASESQRSFTGTWNGQYGIWETRDDGVWVLVKSREEMAGATSSSSGQDPWEREDPWQKNWWKKDDWKKDGWIDYDNVEPVISSQDHWTKEDQWQDNTGDTSWSDFRSQGQGRYVDKDPPPSWDGKNPEKTWREYRRSLRFWLANTDIPSKKHGVMLWKALTGDAKLLVDHLTDEDLARHDAASKISGLLEQAHRHISEHEDQDDFDKAVFGLHRERGQSLLQFANVARSAFLKADAHGDPLPDRRKGMIFLRRAKIPGHLEDHIMSRTAGSRNFSDLLEAIRVLARRSDLNPSSSGTYLDLDEDEAQDDEDGGAMSSSPSEGFLDYDSEDGTLIPIAEEDLQEVYDEEDLEWALSNYRQERERFKAKNANGGYLKVRDDLNKNRIARGYNAKGFQYRDNRGKFKRPFRKYGSSSKYGRSSSSSNNSSSNSRNKAVSSRGSKSFLTDDKGRPKLRDISELKARTRCRKCNKIGHWAAECPEAQHLLVASEEAEQFFCGMLMEEMPSASSAADVQGGATLSSPTQGEEKGGATSSSPAGEEKGGVASSPPAGSAEVIWDEATNHPIEDRGRYNGKAPRGAGLIIFKNIEQETVVCVVQKRDGKLSFPKGGMKSGEKVPTAATREWIEEVGINPARLIIDMSTWVDDGTIGVRYLVGTCDEIGNDRSEPDQPSPDLRYVMWTPPHEDPDDPDPIMKAMWIPLDRILRNDTALSSARVNQVRQAYDHVRLADGGLADEEYETEIGSFWEQGLVSHGLTERRGQRTIPQKRLERRLRRPVTGTLDLGLS